MRRSLTVLASGPLTTVQDLGRPGRARWGVSPSGAADRRSFRLANRLVANPESAAALECTLGGLRVRAHGDLLVAATGAPGQVTADGHELALDTPVELADGAQLRIATPAAGLRTYVAVRGGLVVDMELGSRSTDLLSGLGPARLQAGDELPVGELPEEAPLDDMAPAAPVGGGALSLRVLPGPRADWFTGSALQTLLSHPYEVTPDSNRVGLKLAGPPLARRIEDELPSEGLVRGALQVPHGGQPVLFLADHPVTGGYPVIAVVVDEDTDLAGQARPGTVLRFRPDSRYPGVRGAPQHYPHHGASPSCRPPFR